MKATRVILVLSLLILGMSFTGCRRSSNQVWEDSKSASRHMSRGLRTMGGMHGHSRAVQYRDDFMPENNGFCVDNGGYDDGAAYNNAAAMGEFVPLANQSDASEIAMADFVSHQPRETPGDPGSSIPGINAFKDPSTNSEWAGVFQNITFEYNSNLVKGQGNIDTIHSIANFMRNRPNIYVFIEGHCDERGPEAYNLALGVRRSNAVRNMLIQEGVNTDNIFTISHGKERPLFYDHNEDSWSQNRRAEFKIYQR